MKKALMFILLYYFCNVNVFSSEEILIVSAKRYHHSA